MGSSPERRTGVHFKTGEVRDAVTPSVHLESSSLPIRDTWSRSGNPATAVLEEGVRDHTVGCLVLKGGTGGNTLPSNPNHLSVNWTRRARIARPGPHQGTPVYAYVNTGTEQQSVRNIGLSLPGPGRSPRKFHQSGLLLARPRLLGLVSSVYTRAPSRSPLSVPQTLQDFFRAR